MNEYRVQRLKEDLTFAQQRNRHQKQQLANYKKVHEKDLKEIERLNNIINDLLKRQNEALNYISNFLSMDNRYKHGNGNDELELVRRILNKHNQELKGSDKEWF